MNSKLTRNVDMKEYTCTAHAITRARKEEARIQSYTVLSPILCQTTGTMTYSV